MVRRNTIAAIRYGYGMRPVDAAKADANFLLDGIGVVDSAERKFPLAPLETRAALMAERRKTRAAARDGKLGSDAAKKRVDRKLREQTTADIRAIFQRTLDSRTGLRERMTAFWADHFTVAAKGPLLSALVPDLIESAIRPHVAGNFGDMLFAVSTHPAMLIYLNQVQSVGPSSRAGKRRGRGLNENLAREILELHTLGVGGAYTQADVRQFAELLTGLSANKSGFVFRRAIVEPGRETVLGKGYGGGKPALNDIRQALHDIALHPDTARHLAAKLITHFVGGDPPDDWVEKMASAYLNAGGELPALYEAMLADDRAWEMPLRKVKLPFDFVVSALRAAGVVGGDLDALKPRDIRNDLMEPLAAMGQPLFRPGGPDGWPEAPEAWITPATLASRLRWSGKIVDDLLKDSDPRDFLEAALGDAASDLLKFAVAGSESRAEGIALVLVSPDFNRR
ncbi:MAG: DUF1800 domain-containing protein [Boseongicola sp.]